MSKNIKMFIEDKNEQWSISLCGEFKDKITEQLVQDEIPKTAVDKIFDNAVSILSHCPNPYKEKNNGKTRDSNRKSSKRKNL